MDVNMKWYKQDMIYDDGLSKEEKVDLLNYIHQTNENDYRNILKNDKRVGIFTNLSNIRQNIINWYDFKNNANVLEIGADYGAITGILCEKFKRVVSIESQKIKALAVAKRYEKKDNLEIICANLEDVNFEEKFDYITLIGTLDYFKDENQILSICKRLIKENGTIILTLNNKFGIKYFAGAKTSVNSSPYESITANSNLKSKYEIENMLKNNDLLNYKFFYPLPDYKLPSVIFSQDFIPNENNSKLNYHMYYNKNDNIVFNEVELLKQLIKSNQFEFYANSFFIEINNIKNDLRFISYNNMRIESDRLITKIFTDKVIKSKVFKSGNDHINLIKHNIELLQKLGFNVLDKIIDNKVESLYVNAIALDEVIVNHILHHEFELAYEKIEMWYHCICEKLGSEHFENYKDRNIFKKYNVHINDIDLKKLRFTKNGFLDIVFENIFIVKNEYQIYDQEWFEEFVPLEFILYRSLHNMYFHNKKIQNILPINNLYEKYGIIKYLEIFEALEEKWQSSLGDQVVIDFYTLTYVAFTNINDLKDMIGNLQEKVKRLENAVIVYEKDIEDLKNKIELLNEQYEGKNKELEKIKEKYISVINSRSWRYTKFLRKNNNIDEKEI